MATSLAVALHQESRRVTLVDGDSVRRRGHRRERDGAQSSADLGFVDDLSRASSRAR
jgi:adenylylsulfate kinase-like enzyme